MIEVKAQDLKAALAQSRKLADGGHRTGHNHTAYAFLEAGDGLVHVLVTDGSASVRQDIKGTGAGKAAVPRRETLKLLESRHPDETVRITPKKKGAEVVVQAGSIKARFPTSSYDGYQSYRQFGATAENRQPVRFSVRFPDPPADALKVTGLDGAVAFLKRFLPPPSSYSLDRVRAFFLMPNGRKAHLVATNGAILARAPVACHATEQRAIPADVADFNGFLAGAVRLWFQEPRRAKATVLPTGRVIEPPTVPTVVHFAGKGWRACADIPASVTLPDLARVIDQPRPVRVRVMAEALRQAIKDVSFAAKGDDVIGLEVRRGKLAVVYLGHQYGERDLKSRLRAEVLALKARGRAKTAIQLRYLQAALTDARGEVELRWGPGANILVRGSHGEVYVSPLIIQGYNRVAASPQGQMPHPLPTPPSPSDDCDEEEAA
ncbi:MAG: hypothetical protein HY557_05330 [Euryarchaeota archaeon]|nr:hypothetical protein [Euryarchaeota archaeon]